MHSHHELSKGVTATSNVENSCKNYSKQNTKAYYMKAMN